MGLLKKETYPVIESGTNFHLIETQINRTSPVTKVGKEVPRRTNTELIVSGARPRNCAAKIPSETPTTNQRIRAPIARVTVIGRASAKRVVTHSFSLNEYPKLGAGHSKAA
jgi:hypothetical protein